MKLEPYNFSSQDIFRNNTREGGSIAVSHFENQRRQIEK